MEAVSPATFDDVPELARLVNSAYRGEAAKKGWTHEADLIEGDLRTDENTLHQLLSNQHSTILKYTGSNDITGCVYLEKQGRHLYLGMLSVAPDAQGRGIGKRLLVAAEKFAQLNGCIAIDMTVISERKELIAWYARNGYIDTGIRKPFHTDTRFGIPRRHVEFLVMRKSVVAVQHAE